MFIPLYQKILLHIKIMETYCVSCKKKVLRTEILMLKELNKKG